MSPFGERRVIFFLFVKTSKFIKMLIYKDVFTGDELFSDTYKIVLKDEVLYEVYGKYKTRKHGEVVLPGANASAEEADEGTEDAAESGIDIVLNHRLVETGFPDKKAFTDYLKSYMKKVIKYLEENNKSSEIDGFKTNIQKVIQIEALT